MIKTERLVIMGALARDVSPGVSICQDPFLLGHYKEYEQTVDTDRLDKLELAYGKRVYEHFGIIPMFCVLPQIAVGLEVVVEYQGNMGNCGRLRYLGLAVPVYKEP